MSLIPWWMKLIAVAALVAGVAWGVHLYDKGIRDKQHAVDVAEYNVKLLAAQTKAAEDTARLTKEKDDAIAQRADAEKKSAALKLAAAADSSRLRDTIANLRSQLSGYSVETCRAYADTGLRLLGICQERYRFVAERAKGHYADEVMFDEAWPK